MTGQVASVDDPLDQDQRVLRAAAKPDEGHVRALPGGHRADVVDLDFACDHLVAERDHNRDDQLEPVSPFVRDQNA